MQQAATFPLSARVGGRDFLFLGTDIVTGLFFDGFPDDMPLTQCWQKQDAVSRIERVREQEAWHDKILTRAVYVLLNQDTGWTVLTPELVQRLGAARDELVIAYFSAIGWIRPEDKEYRECDLPTPEGITFAPSPPSLCQRRAIGRIPGHNLLWIVKEVAQRSAVNARQVWRTWPVSDFIWNYRVSLEPELTKAKQEKSIGGLTPEQAAIGTTAGG